MQTYLKTAVGIAAAFTVAEASAASFIVGPAALNAQVGPRTTPVYEEGFEDFALGTVDGQFGWVSTFPPNTNIDVFPSEGLQNLSMITDGSGVADLVFSPVFGDLGLGDSVTMSVDFATTGGSSFEIITQSTTQQLVNTRVLIDPNGGIAALEDDSGSAVFTDTGATAAPGYNTLEIEVERATGIFTLDLNGAEIFSGLGFATLLDQIVFLSANDGATAGDFFDIDDISVSQTIPVPGAAPLFAAGLLALARRRRKAA